MSASPTPPEEGRHSCRPALPASGQEPTTTLTTSTIHPSPIHRRKSFWLGILILTFLAWAWRDSTYWQTILRHRQYALTHAGSGISLADRKVDPHRPPWERYPIRQVDNEVWARAHIDAPELFHSTGEPKLIYRYYIRKSGTNIRLPRNSAALHFRPLLDPAILVIAPNSRAIFIPHWLIILLFLIPWTALLLWRSRRLRHLTKPAE